MNVCKALPSAIMALLVSTQLVHTSVPVQQDILVPIVKPTSTNVIAIRAFTTVHVLMVSIRTNVTVVMVILDEIVKPISMNVFHFYVNTMVSVIKLTHLPIATVQRLDITVLYVTEVTSTVHITA